MRPARHARCTPSFSVARQSCAADADRGARLRLHVARARAPARAALASASSRSRFIVTPSTRRGGTRAAARRARSSTPSPKPIVSNTRWTNGSGSALGGGRLHRARQHLLRAAAGGNQADADLDEADVGFRRGLHAVGVQRRSRSRRRASARRARRRPARPRASAPSSRPGTRGPSGRSRPSCPPAPRAAAASGSRRRRSSARRCRRRARAKFAAASLTPACSIWIVSPPIAFIFEWNSTQSTPSPRSTQARARRLAFLATCAETGRRRPAGFAAGSSAPDERGSPRRVETPQPIASSSNGPRSQPKPHCIARSTSSMRVGDLGRDLARRRRASAPSVACAGSAPTLSRRRGRARRCVRSRPRSTRAASSDGSFARLPRPVLERRRDRASRIVAVRLLLVEALAALRSRPCRARSSSRRAAARRTSPGPRRAQALGEVARDVRQHVDARDVHRPERRALRAADRRTGDRVDLLDRVLAASRARGTPASRRRGRGGSR